MYISHDAPGKHEVFVGGCFWHCCPRHSNLPVNNRLFWERKLEGNRRRDGVVSRRLRAAVRVWEHELSRKNRGRLLGRIARALKSEIRIKSE
jgi:DNA mismatch endonuclease (patch repair protein)